MEKDCNTCGEKIYICEGDYICGCDPTKIVVEDFGCPSDDWMWCNGKNWVEE